MPPTPHRPSMSSSLAYKDPRAALEWLERAFGFERTMVITNDAGELVHSEMSVGRDGLINVASEWADFVAAPSSVGGKNTQLLHVQLDGGVEAHCARARAAGAEILAEPSDQFYGDRTYRARDPGGHVWTFAQTVKAVSREEAEAASGLKIEGWV